jgi:hypothetical protein
MILWCHLKDVNNFPPFNFKSEKNRLINIFTIYLFFLITLTSFRPQKTESHDSVNIANVILRYNLKNFETKVEL